VKINEVVVEGLYDTLAGARQAVKRTSRKPGAETQAFKAALANVPSPEQQQASQISKAIKGIPATSDAELLKTWDEWMQYPEFRDGTQGPSEYADAVEKELAKRGLQYTPRQKVTKQSEFIKQFKIIDDNPLTVQWKNQEFQRKDGTGQWVNFPGGKPVSQQMVAALDKVSPLPTTNKPAPVQGGVKAISVKDNAGVVWTKDEDNNRWLNDAGTVADPAHVTGLEKRALTQYQARQMGA